MAKLPSAQDLPPADVRMANAPYVRLGQDRRQPDRLQIPPCVKCDGGDLAVTMRTPYVVYTRCANCGDIQVFRKPDQARREKAARQ